MKKALLIMFIGFIFVNGYGQKTKIQSEFIYFDSKKTMIASEKSFYKKGHNHILHGDCKEYYRNGQLMSIKTYENGELNGKWIEYYESGQILFESNYTNGQCSGDYEKYYENGEIMIQAICQSNKFVALKHGFPDGKYAISKKTNDSTNFYELYDKSGKIIETTDSDIKSLENKSNPNCKILAEFRYPAILIEKQLEGLVILELIIGTDGKIKNINPLAGFHEEAIKESIKSINRTGCFEIKTKDNQPIEYKIRIPIVYKMI